MEFNLSLIAAILLNTVHVLPGTIMQSGKQSLSPAKQSGKAINTTTTARVTWRAILLRAEIPNY